MPARRDWTCYRALRPPLFTCRRTWTGRGTRSTTLDAPGRVVDLYRAVLIEAASPQDLYAYPDEKILRWLWALLWLPAQLRRAWELRFPVLAEISRVTATA
jgi:hypothetical protein